MAIKIDKSLFTPEELEQYQALIAKASVDPAGNEEMMDDPGIPEEWEVEPRRTEPTEQEDQEEPEVEIETEKSCRTRKSANAYAAASDPVIQKALQDLEDLKKSAEMQVMTNVAKKYAILGKKEDELAKTLYTMKKSSPESYDAYLDVLDQSLDIVEKSGLFTEIGKSTHGDVGGSAVDKIQSAASDIQKSDPRLSREMAVAKAWEAHPELVAEYDKEYRM